MLGRLASLLCLPVAGPLQGLGWVAGQIAGAAEREAFDPARVEAALRRLEHQLEAGEIDEAAFERQEAEQLALLAVIRARRAG
jgi:chorismate mutase